MNQLTSTQRVHEHRLLDDGTVLCHFGTRSTKLRPSVQHISCCPHPTDRTISGCDPVRRPSLRKNPTIQEVIDRARNLARRPFLANKSALDKSAHVLLDRMASCGWSERDPLMWTLLEVIETSTASRTPR